MNISSLPGALYAYYSHQDGSERNNSRSFAGVIELMRSASAAASTSVQPTDTSDRAAAVRLGLDAKTVGYLDKYTEIYNKYADKYGDGFELKGTLYLCGDAASEAEAEKYNAIRADFQNELFEAGIPGEYPFEAALISQGSVDFNGFAVARGYLGGPRTGIGTLFYAEKYGLAGLSPEEQVEKVLGGLKNGSANELREAVELLYRAGAISGMDVISIGTKTYKHAVSSLGENPTAAEILAALDKPVDWSGLLDSLRADEEDSPLLELLSQAWRPPEEDAESERLEALMHRIDSLQTAIHEEIELRIHKLREQQLLDRANAESARLRIFLGLDSLSDLSAAELGLDSASSAIHML